MSCNKKREHCLKTGCSDELSVYKLFEQKAKKVPNNIAIKFKDEAISYYELNNKIDYIANVLRSKNVGRKDIVAIMMKRSIDIIVSIFAVLKVGAAYLPIDPEYPEQRIKFMLTDSNASFVLTHSSMEDKIDNLKVLHIDKLYRHNSQENAYVYEGPISEDLAYIIYTSGSTGNPKGVMIEHKAVVNFIKGITEIIDFNEGKKILALTTVSFDIFVLEALLPLTRGLTVILTDENTQKNPKLLSNTIIDNCVDMIQITPSMMQLLVNHDKELGCLKNLKEIMIGGEAFPEILLDKIKIYSSAKIYNMYGPTETTVWSTVSDLTEKNNIDIGKPILNTQIFIVDESNNLVKEGQEGELCIGGAGLARGYLNRPELTKERFVQNPFIPGERMYKTGDLAKWLPDGNINCLGRIDNQVKIRGNRVELEEIESYLLNYGSINQVVVVAKEGKENTKYLCAYFVSTEEIPVSDIRNHLLNSLPDFMVPSYFIRLDSLPRTPNGKIDRNSLSEIELQQTEYVQDSINNHQADSVEVKVKKIICENTDISIRFDEIDIDGSLNELGINSITFIQIVVTIETEFDFEFEDEDLDANKFPTVQSLISYVEKGQ